VIDLKMKTPMPTLLAAAFLICVAVFQPAFAADRLVLGRTAADWQDSPLIFNALDAFGNGSLAPLEADTTENLLPRVVELGGNAQTSVTTAAARSNEILDDLIDGDASTGWRVYTNTNGAELQIDLGAVFFLRRVLLERGVFNRDDRSLRGYELYVNDGDSLNFVDDPGDDEGPQPLFSLVSQDRSHGELELDVSMLPQPVRFMKLRSTGERSFQMGDLQVFGVGVTPFAQYTSRIYDLGGSANFGPIEIHASVDEKAVLNFSTRTGATPDDSLYFEQTGIPGQFNEVTRNTFDRSLDPSYAGVVRVNDRDWSAWSPAYVNAVGPLSSPDSRRFIQFDFRFISNGLTDKAVVDSVVINYTVPALADSIVAEIFPAEATLGESNEFEYHLRSVFDGGERGFDTVVINTPFNGEATAVTVDGLPVSSFEQSIDGNRLRVSFPDDRVSRTDQQVMVRFTSLVTVAGTAFRGEVEDSQSDAFPQRTIAGDADEAIESNSLIVSGQIVNKLLANVDFSSPVVTPNADGVNDELILNYTLLKATSVVDVDVIVYNLAGQPVRILYRSSDLTGPNTVNWDGCGGAGCAQGGERLAPGLYVIRLSVDSDSDGDAVLKTVAVAY
jgi:hypothetical protein